MPAVFINLGNRHGIGLHVIGQKYKSFTGFTINELDPSNEFRIIRGCIGTGQAYFLVAEDTFAFINLFGIQSLELCIFASSPKSVGGFLVK